MQTSPGKKETLLHSRPAPSDPAHPACHNDPDDKMTHIHAHMHSSGIIHAHPHRHAPLHDHHQGGPDGPILTVSGLGFGYRGHDVLSNIDIDVTRGEILAVLGPNGVGKSTFLKCLNQILRPKTGTILLDKKDLMNLSGNEVAKHLGYVSQKTDTPRMTVYDAVLLGRKPHMGWKLSEKDHEIVRSALRKFGLTDMQLRHIDEVSGGELQRICICRAIVQEPDVLLLDEPTSALDLCRQMDILKVIRHVVDTHDVATVMTMHDLNLALRFADRFVFMKNGNVFAVCSRKDVTADIIGAVYGISVDVEIYNGLPIVIPHL